MKKSDLKLIEKIKKLKHEINAVILAHYYQSDDIQDVADFIGDSFDLSKKAAQTNAEIIIFCGVRFMAEVAKILSPQKRVFIPDMNAGCSLEESCPEDEFRKFKSQHPNHLCLTYINCSAQIKALSDIIVTSSSAEKIINQLPKEQKIIFAPDKHLGSWISKKTGRDMLLWDGSCVVHEQFSEKELVKLTVKYPDAIVIAHPECPEKILKYANHIGSTSSLINFVKNHQGNEFIILTEPGIIHQMRKINPKGVFHECSWIDEAGCKLCAQCPYMKLNNMQNLYDCMKYQRNEIILDKDLIEKAKKPLNKMLTMA